MIAPEPAAAPPPKAESRRLAPGSIQVRILEVLDSGARFRRFVRASIAEDVKGADSRLAIPAGANAIVEPLAAGKDGDKSEIGLSLYSVEVDGHQYLLTGEDQHPAVVLVSVDSVRNPAIKSAHISEGDILEFRLRKPAELR